MSGAIAMGTSKITGLGDPTAAQDAATKNYVDTTSMPLAGGTFTGDVTFNSGQSFPGVLPLSGGTMTGNITFNSGQTIDGYVSFTTSTGSAELPVGTTAQRDASPAAGMIRYNSTLGQFEGYSTEWGAIGGGATGAGGDAWALEHDNTITTSYTISTGKNVISAGPLTVNSGAVITVPSGSSWTIV